MAPTLTSLSLCLRFPKCKTKVKAPTSEGHCENWVNVAQLAPAAPGTQLAPCRTDYASDISNSMNSSLPPHRCLSPGSAPALLILRAARAGETPLLSTPKQGRERLSPLAMRPPPMPTQMLPPSRSSLSHHNSGSYSAHHSLRGEMRNCSDPREEISLLLLP